MRRLAKAGCDQTTGRPQSLVGGLEQVGAADFLVAARAELGDDQVALFVEEEEAVAVLHDERIGPADGFAGGGGLEGFPDALAGLRLQAAQLAVAADAVNVAVFEEGRAHDGVEVGGVLLVHLERAPDGGGGGFGRVEPQHERAAVKGGEEEQVAQLARRGDGHAGARFEGHRPIDLAGHRVERVGRLGMPEDELPLAAGLVDDRRAVARLLGAQRAPDLLAGVLVEGDRRAAGAAHQANQPVAVQQRMPGEAPHAAL